MHNKSVFILRQLHHSSCQLCAGHTFTGGSKYPLQPHPLTQKQFHEMAIMLYLRLKKPIDDIIMAQSVTEYAV